MSASQRGAVIGGIWLIGLGLVFLVQQMGLGSTSVDEGRFPRAAAGWASPDYEAAARRAEIRIQGGVGSVRIGSA